MSARVEIDTKAVDQMLAEYLDQNSLEVAKVVATRARATTAFKDKTGTLRRSIRAKKSRYPDGGAIVSAGAPHSHLIEFGHKGAAARPFLRPALDQSLDEARLMFGAE